ncbi:uroporphyrinogen-III C-methyltransferase [Priestia abyssalis]|uniref:uroporphyrinogen-III C-methyltransferase n=1 Tax=Priestia abyssalis TaxID=1221450 RepID=UPI001F16784D|nr:uroporphyrinogen-III C-methyltransferase [Priestia abyssalis]
MMEKGTVYLVGAGPGDVRLITVKGKEAIQQAQVILYDRLANPKLLEFAPADCELIYCGKLPDRHTLRQEGINELLVAKAKEGKRVVRLKGGDPGVFGRGGEEAAALAEHNIPFEIVPGITSGIAASTYAGIPVTHREYGTSFAVVTAHDKSEDGKPSLKWKGLADSIDTIAFYMGVSNLPYICENLMKHGKAPDTPVILIQWGTYGRQKTVEGTLATIVEKVAAIQFSNPAITLVGEVVSVRDQISWFEKKPLFGRQILLARTSTTESKVAEQLTRLGADVIEFPKWKKTAVNIDKKIIENIHTYDSILFASPESAMDFFTILFNHGIDLRRIRADFFVHSKKSMKVLNERGLLAKWADEMGHPGSLLLVGENHHLQHKGDGEAYDIMMTGEKQIDGQFMPVFLRMLEEAHLDTLIFPSSASVKPFMEGLKACGLDAYKLIEDIKVVCMGSKTSLAAQDAGITVDYVPKERNVNSLVECLKEIGE